MAMDNQSIVQWITTTCNKLTLPFQGGAAGRERPTGKVYNLAIPYMRFLALHPHYRRVSPQEYDISTFRQGVQSTGPQLLYV